MREKICSIHPLIRWSTDESENTMSKLTKRDIVVSISNQTGMVQHQVFEVV